LLKFKEHLLEAHLYYSNCIYKQNVILLSVIQPQLMFLIVAWPLVVTVYC